MGFKVKSLVIFGDQNRKVIEQLSACTSNVTHIEIEYSNNCMDWLTVDALKNWKLKGIHLYRGSITTPLLLLIAQTCTELTSVKLYSNTVDDAAVIAIAQHCSNLETLQLMSKTVTWISLLTLSEQSLPLKELDIDYIPNIPTADIARRCGHALSRIHDANIFRNRNAEYYIPYLTGLTVLKLDSTVNPGLIPLLAQHCHSLHKLYIYHNVYCTDTVLIELIHGCPHLHTLYIPFKNAITDTGIITLSEHCPQLQRLTVNRCHNVTEVTSSLDWRYQAIVYQKRNGHS